MIHTLTATHLAAIRGMLSLENDFVMCEQLTQMPYINDAFQSEMLMVFYCLNGHLSMNVGDGSTVLSAGDAYLCKPHLTVHQVLTSTDCHATVLFYSPHIAEQLLPARQNLSEVLEGCPHTRVRFGAKLLAERLLPLLDMLRQQASDAHLPFQSNTLYHLFSLLLFEVLNPLCRRSAPAVCPAATPSPASRADTLYNGFIRLLNEDGGRHRTVSYYADRLCITPKHLSKVVREKTQTRALEIINRHAIGLIKLDLKLTDIPIRQLANKYGFDNFSFFCQYVKSHLGLTPKEYRQQ